jgi:hypothetical protein
MTEIVHSTVGMKSTSRPFLALKNGEVGPKLLEELRSFLVGDQTWPAKNLSTYIVLILDASRSFLMKDRT